MINEFKKIAPYIVETVKARVTDTMSDDEVMQIIHAEIVSFFEKQQNMFTQFLTFTSEQRTIFTGIMYDVLAPLAATTKPTINPVYQSYVERTGKTGALNFITQRDA